MPGVMPDNIRCKTTCRGQSGIGIFHDHVAPYSVASMMKRTLVVACMMLAVGCCSGPLWSAVAGTRPTPDTTTTIPVEMDASSVDEESPSFSEEELQEHLEYPDSAVRNGIEGRLVIAARISEEGRVDSILVVQPAHPVLNAAAVHAMRSVSYLPAFFNGNPVSSWIRIPFHFELREYLQHSGPPSWTHGLLLGVGYSSLLEPPSMLYPYHVPGYLSIDAAYHQERPFRGGAVVEYRANGLTASYAPSGTSILSEIPYTLGFMSAGYLNLSGYAYRLNEQTRLYLHVARSPFQIVDIPRDLYVQPGTFPEAEEKSYGSWIRPSIGLRVGASTNFQISYERSQFSAKYGAPAWLAIGLGEMTLDYAIGGLLGILKFIPPVVVPVLDFSFRTLFALWVSEAKLGVRESYSGGVLVQRIREGLDYRSLTFGVSYVF